MLTENEIIQELSSSRQIPLSFHRSMAGHEHPELRVRATWSWQSLTPEQRKALLDDPDPAVREAAQGSRWELDPEAVEATLPSIGSHGKPFVLGTCALSPALVEECFAEDKAYPLAWNRHTPAYAVARLARHPEAEVRALVAARPDLGPDLVAELREDPDEDVRMRARLHPFPRTWAEYWAIHAVIGHGPDCTCPITEVEPTSRRPTGSPPARRPRNRYSARLRRAGPACPRNLSKLSRGTRRGGTDPAGLPPPPGSATPPSGRLRYPPGPPTAPADPVRVPPHRPDPPHRPPGTRGTRPGRSRPRPVRTPVGRP